MNNDWLTEAPVAAPKGFATRANLLLALGVCTGLSVLIGGGMYVARPVLLFWSKADTGGGVAGEDKASLTGGDDLNPDDPILRFKQTGVGQVLFNKGSSGRCSRVLFDNRTGASYVAKDVDCGQKAEPVVQEVKSTNRMTAVRQSFNR
jgi:hypothetical protein